MSIFLPNFPEPPTSADPSVQAWARETKRVLNLVVQQMSGAFDVRRITDAVTRRLLDETLFFPHAFELNLSSDQTITDAVTTSVSWGTIVKDQGFALTAPLESVVVQRTGWYLIVAGAEWDSNSTGRRFLSFRTTKESTTASHATNRKTALENSEATISTITTLLQGDTIGPVRVNQTSGGNLNLRAVRTTFFAAYWLGPMSEGA